MYQLLENTNYVKRDADGAIIPDCKENRHFIEYQKWFDDGNTPSPVDPPTIYKQRSALKATRDSALQGLTHDFEDGRVMQVRPTDAGNIQIAIGAGVDLEWVMVDDSVATVTPAELQMAFDAGVQSTMVVWSEYMTALKAL